MQLFPCSVRSVDVENGTTIEIKTLTFDDLTLAFLKTLTFDVRIRFTNSDKTTTNKDFPSTSLSTKFSTDTKTEASRWIRTFRFTKNLMFLTAKTQSFSKSVLNFNLLQASQDQNLWPYTLSIHKWDAKDLNK